MTARTSHIVLIFAAFLTGLVIFSGVFLYATGNFRPGEKSCCFRDLGRRFKLVHQNGTAITDADLKGKPHLVFFGYTHCPDVCPTTLFDVSERFGARSAGMQMAPVPFSLRLIPSAILLP